MDIDAVQFAKFQCTIRFPSYVLNKPVAYRYFVHSIGGTGYSHMNSSFESLSMGGTALCRGLHCNVSEGMLQS